MEKSESFELHTGFTAFKQLEEMHAASMPMPLSMPTLSSQVDIDVDNLALLMKQVEYDLQVFIQSLFARLPLPLTERVDSL